MRYRTAVLSVAIVALAAIPVVAEEIIYFKNGASLAIRGHKITEGMVHVDMGEDAFIGFPATMVDRIEQAGKDVYVPPSSALGLKKNQMVEGSTSGRRVTSRHMRDPQAGRDYRNRSSVDRVEVDENGMAFVRAYPGTSGARRQFKVTGRDMGGVTNLDPDRGLVGTRRLGTSQVIGEMRPEQSRGVILSRPQLSPNTPFKPPKGAAADGSPETGSDDASEGDSSGE